MPPCGFRQKGTNGLLLFVKGIYEYVLKKYSDLDLTDEAQFNQMKTEFEKLSLESLSGLNLRLSEEAIKGLQIFLLDNFQYMLDLMKLNLKESYGPKTEINDINNYLELMGEKIKSFTLGKTSSIPYEKIPAKIRF